MIWLFLLAVILAMAFFKMGVLVVWFGLLKSAVQFLLFIGGGFVLYGIWKWVARKRSSQNDGRQPQPFGPLVERSDGGGAETVDPR